jgi:hypothetical protein
MMTTAQTSWARSSTSFSNSNSSFSNSNSNSSSRSRSRSRSRSVLQGSLCRRTIKNNNDDDKENLCSRFRLFNYYARKNSRKNCAVLTKKKRTYGPVMTEARIRPGRQAEQRKFRIEKERESIGIYEYLEQIGVKRSQALRVIAEATMQFEAEFAKRTTFINRRPQITESTEETEERADGTKPPGATFMELKFGEEEVRKVVTFLESREIKDEELGKLITDFPAVLAYDVETRLEPLFEYVVKVLGISALEFAKEIQRRPSLLGLRADENVSKMVEYLESTGCTREEIIEYLMKTL